MKCVAILLCLATLSKASSHFNLGHYSGHEATSHWSGHSHHEPVLHSHHEPVTHSNEWEHSPLVYAKSHSYEPAPLNHDGTVADTPAVQAARAAHLAAHAQEKAKALHSHSELYRFHQPHLTHDGTVAETPEVQLAKAHHFAAHAKAQLRHKRSLSWLWSSAHNPAPLNHDGTVAETPEVKAAKAHHFAAHAEAKSRNFLHHSNHFELGPSIYAHGHLYDGASLGHNGAVTETPEVLAAKAHHFAEHAKAASRNLHSHESDYEPQLYHSYGSAYHYAHLNHDGTVAETPEVQAAKAHHFAAHAKALHRYKRSHLWSWSPSHEPAPLNHDGTVAETPEVKAAKAHHFAAHAEANSRSLAVHHPSFAHSPEIYAHAAPIYAPSAHLHGHYIQPAPLNHDGTVADTPEIQAAKAHHFAAHNEAISRIAHKYHY